MNNNTYTLVGAIAFTALTCNYSVNNQNLQDSYLQETYKKEAVYYPAYSTPKSSNVNIDHRDKKLLEDYKTIENFARKLLTDIPVIDCDIQKVINEHFWDML